MKRHFSQRQRFSIRKFSIGACSILLGTIALALPLSASAQASDPVLPPNTEAQPPALLEEGENLSNDAHSTVNPSEGQPSSGATSPRAEETPDSNDLPTVDQIRELLAGWVYGLQGQDLSGFTAASRAPLEALLAQGNSLLEQASPDPATMLGLMEQLDAAYGGLVPESAAPAGATSTPSNSPSSPSSSSSSNSPSSSAPSNSSNPSASSGTTDQPGARDELAEEKAYLNQFASTIEGSDLSQYSDEERALYEGLARTARTLINNPSTSAQDIYAFLNQLRALSESSDNEESPTDSNSPSSPSSSSPSNSSSSSAPSTSSNPSASSGTTDQPGARDELADEKAYLNQFASTIEGSDLSQYSDEERAFYEGLARTARTLINNPSTSAEDIYAFLNQLRALSAPADDGEGPIDSANRQAQLTGGVVDSNLQYPQSKYDSVTLLDQGHLTAWRNDTAVSQLTLKTGDEALQNVRLEISDFVDGDKTISKEHLTAHFIKSVQAFTGMVGYGNPTRPIPAGNREEANEVIYQTDPINMAERSLQNVWLSIKVPEAAAAGRYQGTVRVLADNLTEPLTFNYTLEVADAVLKPATSFKDSFDIELWQNPFAVAEHYGVEPFSEKHFEILRPHMEKYKALGGHAVTTTIVEEAWAGQTYSKNEVKFPSMIDWTKKADGSFSFDYTKFDKWVEFNQSLGLGDKIVGYSVAPWTNQFRYFDEATGQKVTSKYTVGSDEYNKTWKAFLQDFIVHAEKKGWKDKIYIGIDERGFDKRAFDLIDSITSIDGKPFKTAGAMDGFVNKRDLAMRVHDLNVGANAVKAHPVEFESLRKARAERGLRTTIYTATGEAPGNFSLSAPGESYWTMLYAYAVGGQGFLRWAYDSWVENPLEDATHNAFETGDPFLVYPDNRTSANPVSKSTTRLEKMAEGVRDVNKLIQIKEETPALAGRVDALLKTVKATYPKGRLYLTEEGKQALATDMKAIKDEIASLSQAHVELLKTGQREVTGIRINGDVTQAMSVGTTRQLDAVLEPANLINPLVTWTSSNPLVATVSETGLVTALKAGQVTITATSKQDPSQSAQVALTLTRLRIEDAAQVAYYSFDDSNNPTKDAWGQRDGQNQAGSSVQGISGQGLRLEAGQQIRFNHLSDLNHNWSVGYWVYNESTVDGRQSILSSQDGQRALVQRLSAKNTKAGIQTDKSARGVLTFQHTAPTGEWTHYTWTNSEQDGLSLYVNGKHVQTNAWTKTNNYVAPLDILGSTGFTGTLDELKIYNRALTAPEVVASMQVKGLNVAESAIDLLIDASHQVNVDLVSDLEDKTVTYTIANPEIATVDSNGRVTALKKGRTSLVIENQAGGYRKDIPIEVSKRLEIQYTIPTYKMPEENLSDIEKAPGTNRQYLAHPDMLMLDDNQTLITAFVVGHGRGPIVMKVSRDGGETWTEKTDIPASWAGSYETPTLYKLNFKDGSQKLIMIAGRPNWHGNPSGGWDTSISTDNGQTWSEYKLFQPRKEDGSQNWSIVAMSSLTQLKDEDGNFIDKWMGLYIDPSFVNYKTYLTFDAEGNEQWSEPEKLIPEHRDIEAATQLAEVGVFRSPDGKRLVALGRSQSHNHKSTMFYSDDEGKTWTRPEFMQGALQGERHKIAYDPISGRLLVTFREITLDHNKDGKITPGDWRAGEWVAWVGTYDDIMNQNEGQYRIILAEDWAQNTFSGDTGYAGLVVQPDGTFIMNSYGHFDREFSEKWKGGVTTDLSYIKQAKFKLGQVDQALGLVDKTPLKQRLTALESVAADGYTPESYQAFRALLAQATALHDSRTSQQVELDRMLKQLETAESLLVVPVSTTRTRIEREPLAYSVSEIEDDSLAPGTRLVERQGVPGYLENHYEESYLDGQLVSSRQVDSHRQEAVSELVRVGTGTSAVPEVAPEADSLPEALPTTRTRIEREPLAYSASEIEDDSLAPGTRLVERQGVPGYIENHYEDSYLDGQLVSSRQVDSHRQEAVSELVRVGTGTGAVPEVAPEADSLPEALLTTRTRIEREPLAYEVSEIEDDSLAPGTRLLERQGVPGYIENYYEDSYLDDQLVSSRQVDSHRQEAVAELVRVGVAKAISGPRELRDASSRVRVQLGAGESSDIVSLRVLHKETDNLATPAILTGRDYDLYDIELVDGQGQVVKMAGEALVILPLDEGKEVEAVVYLPNADERENLDFTPTVIVDDQGQTQPAVVFVAKHFSEYAIVYRSVAQELADYRLIIRVDGVDQESLYRQVSHEQLIDALAALTEVQLQAGYRYERLDWLPDNQVLMVFTTPSAVVNEPTGSDEVQDVPVREETGTSPTTSMPETTESGTTSSPGAESGSTMPEPPSTTLPGTGASKPSEGEPVSGPSDVPSVTLPSGEVAVVSPSAVNQSLQEKPGVAEHRPSSKPAREVIQSLFGQATPSSAVAVEESPVKSVVEQSAALPRTGETSSALLMVSGLALGTLGLTGLSKKREE